MSLCCWHDEAVDELEFAEQPLTGFDYGYWFDCAACGTRSTLPRTYTNSKRPLPQQDRGPTFRVAASATPKLT